eukprot:5368365-Prymnesium_polylepis.1
MFSSSHRRVHAARARVATRRSGASMVQSLAPNGGSGCISPSADGSQPPTAFHLLPNGQGQPAVQQPSGTCALSEQEFHLQMQQ